jgi:hypothetical protein
MTQLVDFANHLGDVQQRFAGDATAEQASAAKPRFGFDDHDIQAFIGSQKSRRVTARTSAQDNNRTMHEDKPID